MEGQQQIIPPVAPQKPLWQIDIIHQQQEENESTIMDMQTNNTKFSGPEPIRWSA